MADSKDESKEVEEYPVVRIRERPPARKIEAMMQERPYVIALREIQLLDDLVGVMEDTLVEMASLRREFSSTIPIGKIIPRDFTVTQARPVELSREDEKTLPWISFDMFNDGPGSVRVTVNEDLEIPKSWIAMGESLTVDMKAPIIKRIWFHTLTAVQASIRIFAKK